MTNKEILKQIGEKKQQVVKLRTDLYILYEEIEELKQTKKE